MLQLSTSSNQTLSPGDLLVFDTISFWMGHDECFDDRRPTFANLTVPNGVYEVIFDAALGYQASPIKELDLALLLQGHVIPEAVMALTPIPPLRFFSGTVGTFLINPFVEWGNISISNIGERSFIVQSGASLKILRIG